MPLKNRVAKSLLWAAAGVGGRQFASLLIFLVLARILTPAEIGLFAIVMAVYAFMQVFVESGVGDAIVQRDQLDDSHLDSAFWLNLGLGIVVAGIGLAAGYGLSKLFGQPVLVEMVAVLSVSLLINALVGIHQANLRRRFRFKTLALRQTGATVIGGVVGIAAALSGWGVWSLVFYQFVERTTGSLILWFASPWRPRFRCSLQHWRDLLPYSLNSIGARLTVFGNQDLHRVVLGIMLDPTALGLYTFASRVTSAMRSFFVDTLTLVALSAFSRLQGDRPRLREAFKRSTRMASVVALPLFFGMALIAPHVVEPVFGSQWTEAGPVLQVMALMIVPWIMSSFLGSALRATGHAGRVLIKQVITVAGNLVIVVLCAPFGLVPMVLGLALWRLLQIPLLFRLARKVLDLSGRQYLSFYLPAFAATLVMTSTVLAVQAGMAGRFSDVVVVLSAVFAGGLAYLVVCALVDLKTLRELLNVGRLALGRRNSGEKDAAGEAAVSAGPI